LWQIKTRFSNAVLRKAPLPQAGGGWGEAKKVAAIWFAPFTKHARQKGNVNKQYTAHEKKHIF
jgi:hypothetical protein